MIKDADLGLDSRVSDIVTNGNWRMPSDWTCFSFTAPILSTSQDILKWRSTAGRLEDYSVSLAWNDLRNRASKVDWFHLVWYKQCIPNYSFLLWIVMHGKLKTQDVLCSWDIQHNASLSLLIVRDIMPVAKKNSCTSVVSKLLLAALVYHLWEERNARLLQQKKRSENQVVQLILSTIRLKLMTCRFKRTSRVEELLVRWKLPSSLLKPP
uniref:uncharacterized protein LOC122610274 n=1 Tax=Erigeron canadensis TaxID=72917 RepID=UPI001CB94A74|nr:uncharacterized protein LOC122610274 [Erigeron canadensis]